MDGDTGLEVILRFLRLQVSLSDISGLRQLGCCPDLYKGWQATEACMNLLGNQGWLAREEVPKGTSQVLTDQVLLFAAVERANEHSVV